MQGTQSLNRTSESIARSHRVAAETDQIGVEIIEELGQQRESLVRTKDRVSCSQTVNYGAKYAVWNIYQV